MSGTRASERAVRAVVEPPSSIPQEARLDGQVAVVTGGGRGIGRAAAIRMADAGASVVVTARTESEITEAAEEIRRRGGSALAVRADISEWEAVAALARATESAFGPADIVLANAGVIEPVGPLWEVDAEAWAANLTVNLTGAFFAARAFLPSMVSRRAGVLLFTSSGAAAHPVASWSAYCAAKAGLDHLVRTLQAELRDHDLAIRAHSVYPGVVDTRMQQHIRQKPTRDFPDVRRYQRYHERGVLRPPEEPATLIWWLATPLGADLQGRTASIEDPEIRRRLSEDLGIPLMSGREG